VHDLQLPLKAVGISPGCGKSCPWLAFFHRIFPNICYENTMSNAEGIMKLIMCAEKKAKNGNVS
jgi:hypothetical protein